MNPNRPNQALLPLAFIFVLLIGLLSGYYLQNRQIVANHAFMRNLGGQGNTLPELINFVKDNYVDTVNTAQLNREAIDGMLKSLDPHSIYIPASEFATTNDPLIGNFEGIGIQFQIEHDSVMIVRALPGGPSEKEGLMAGDRIVQVDGKDITRSKPTNDMVMKWLKGPKGTVVKVGVFRRGIRNILPFSITRDVIPTWSLDIAYLVQPGTGYVKLSKFSATTGEELDKALKNLKGQGASKLILDLRGNAGGYLEEAISVADAFLPAGKTIVYTQGMHRPRKTVVATDGGEWDKLPVWVLIDEGSASASEIVAGAIQDNDRGTIAGRRSFGKGLVQEQINLSDGSALRLTTARYYTPTGRCIQKPYDKGSDEYYMEYYHRIEDGELETADSVKLNDSLKYTTPGGRTVYGGGGVMPDVFVPIETNASRSFFNLSVNKGILYQFAMDYTDRNRTVLKKYPNAASFDQGFVVSGPMYQEFVKYATQNGVEAQPAAILASQQPAADLIKAYIARNLFDDKGFYPIYLRNDPTFKKTLQLIGGSK